MLKKQLLIVLTLFAFFGIVQAEQIQTKFSAPFNTLNLDTSEWSVLYEDKSLIYCDFYDDPDVEFFILQGLPLKKVSYSELVKQLSKAKRIVNKVPLLMASFPFINDEDVILGMEEWKEVVINGKKMIKSLELYEEEKISLEDDEVFYSEKYVIGYIFPTGNRIYLISFNVSKERFSELESFFEKTVQNLW